MQLSALRQTTLAHPRQWAPLVAPLLPGFSLAALLALFSFMLAQQLNVFSSGYRHLTVSPIVLAILLGITIRNVAGVDERLQPGLSFSQCRMLQVGVVLLGIRLSFGEFAVIGISSVPLIVICISAALLLTVRLGNRIGVQPRLATLIAAGTSICGATAIATIAPVIGARNHETGYAIACVTLFGIFATLVYPTASHWLFGGNTQQIGLFLGTAVHDTAQVVGAGMIYQNLYGTGHALETATITKLVRNLAMLIVIPLLSISFQSKHATGGKIPHWTRLVPMFIVGFVLMSLLRTVGDLGTVPFGILSTEAWDAIVTLLKRAAEFSMLIAMAALGLNTRLAGIRDTGRKPLALGLFAACTVGLLSFSLITTFY